MSSDKICSLTEVGQLHSTIDAVINKGSVTGQRYDKDTLLLMCQDFPQTGSDAE